MDEPKQDAPSPDDTQRDRVREVRPPRRSLIAVAVLLLAAGIAEAAWWSIPFGGALIFVASAVGVLGVAGIGSNDQ